MRKIKVFIDENLSSQLALGLNELQKPQNIKENIEIEVLSIKDIFGQGALDEDWIPEVGKENGIVITQDFRIQKQRHQKELYIKHKVGIIFFSPPSKGGFTYWEMVKQVVTKWDDIKQIIRRNKTPFAFRTSAKTHFQKLE